MEQAVVITERQRGPVLGVVAFALSVFVAYGVTMTALASYVFNPPDWLRIASMAPAPFALLASVGCAIPALKGRGRAWAIAALAVCALSLVGFVVMIATADY